MATKNKYLKKNPLTKAQRDLLRKCLKNLLGNGLLQETEKPDEVKEAVIKNAFNAVILKN